MLTLKRRLPAWWDVALRDGKPFRVRFRLAKCASKKLQRVISEGKLWRLSPKFLQFPISLLPLIPLLFTPSLTLRPPRQLYELIGSIRLLSSIPFDVAWRLVRGAPRRGASAGGVSSRRGLPISSGRTAVYKVPFRVLPRIIGGAADSLYEQFAFSPVSVPSLMLPAPGRSLSFRGI